MPSARIERDETEPRVERFRKRAEDESFVAALNAALDGADLPPPPPSGSLDAWPVIYIVGAPRSGTTLLSQLLSRTLSVGYIDNLMARFWTRPSVGIRLSRLVLGADARAGISFKSLHGTTAGVSGPHEFGNFWRHWLRLDDATTHHLSEEELRRCDADALRRAIETEILAPFSAPVVFKNVICGFQASWLTTVHPRSLFVYIERDRTETCRSVLGARHARYGRYDTWWSLKPSTFPVIERLSDPCEQVVRQVDDCRREMRAELGRQDVHAVTVEYANLCENPSSIVDTVMSAAAQWGDHLRPVTQSPPCFLPSPGTLLPDDLSARLSSVLEDR